MGKSTGSHSNRFLRWILLEAVTGATRSSPRPPSGRTSDERTCGMKSLSERVRARNPREPGKGRVAVARELAELAHLLLWRKVLYTETPPPRPGSREARAAAEKPKRPRKSFPQVHQAGPRSNLTFGLTGRKFVGGRKGKAPAARKG